MFCISHAWFTMCSACSFLCFSVLFFWCFAALFRHFPLLSSPTLPHTQQTAHTTHTTHTTRTTRTTHAPHTIHTRHAFLQYSASFGSVNPTSAVSVNCLDTVSCEWFEQEHKCWENSGEGSFRYRRANRSLNLGMEANDSTNHLLTGSLRFRSEAGREQLYQVKRMIGGIGNMLFSTYSQTLKWERSKGYCRRTTCASDISTWAIHGMQKFGDEKLNLTSGPGARETVQKSICFSMKNARSFPLKQCFSG